MFCNTPILGIKFDLKSIQGLKKLDATASRVRTLTFVLSAGTIALILIDVKKGIGDLAGIAYNIEMNDWNAFFAAIHTLTATDTLLEAVIRKDADLQALDHMHDPKQKLFWEQIAQGCR